ncbi:protein NCBP2AS2 homolog [Hermetia illucens]|uniref:protein NCBP2AS2 homolog n=1 Tax=Hermetia illucens TaxID=343691 RepID=UPI0018CC35E4|nr:protein NCBP2AS2 homolog [Hermetia illucens]
MVLRFILRHLANNEQLVQRLSESYLVRRSAQLIVAAMYRTKAIAQENNLHEMTPERFRSFLRSFQQNVREGIEDAKVKLKEKKF